jgi:AraC-like DNA-binding protein
LAGRAGRGRLREVIEHRVSPAGDWETVTRPPHPALRPLVHRGYVGYREAAGPIRRLQVPHEAITVILNLGAPIGVTGWAGGGSFVAGLHDRAVVTEQDGEQLGIQMDLTPLGAQMLFGLPMGELSRRVVDFAGVAPVELVERLAETPGWGARFALLDAFLLDRLARASAPRPDVAFAWARLGATHGAIGIGELCTELGCSGRHLSRRFAEDIGLGPKAVARILRFRRVLSLLDGEGGPGRFAEIAAAGGYSDQSHLNRDFRTLAGCSPGAYVARRLPENRGVEA